MEMCGCVWERDATESRADGPFAFSWHFSDCSPTFPCLTVSFFLSFVLRLRGFCCSFLFLSHFSFRARAFLLCSGWLLDFPAPLSLLWICHSRGKYTCMTSVDCRVIASSHVQFDEMKVRHWRSYVRIQASDGCKFAFEAAPLLEDSKPQLIDPATLADAKLESTLTTENNKNLHYLIANLNSRVKLALPCELTRQNRHVHADLPRRRMTTRSPMVRLNSKLSKATLTSRTGKFRRQNIRLNSCSLT